MSDKKTQLELETEIEEAAIMSAGNFGESPDMFHPEFGWIVKDGKTTEAGINFFKEQLEPFELTTKRSGRS